MKYYKIISKNTDKIYIGKSNQKYLSDRWSNHKTSYRRWLKDNNNIYCSSFIVLEYGDCELILLEECDEEREKYWIDYYKNSINIIRLTGGKQYEDRKDYFKIQNKLNRDKNKVRNLTKYQCECGGSYSYINKTTHFKTKKHIMHSKGSGSPSS